MYRAAGQQKSAAEFSAPRHFLLLLQTLFEIITDQVAKILLFQF